MSHPFVDAGRRVAGPSGRTYAVCATCGHKRIGTSHVAVGRSASAKRTRPRPAALVVVPPLPVAPPAPAVRVADWRLSLLRLALDQALEGPHLELVTRLKLEDARRALRSELVGTVATTDVVLRPSTIAPAAEPAPDPTSAPRTRPPVDQHSGELRKVARSFRAPKMRDLFLRATRAGWRWQLAGSGHVRLYGPAGAVLTLSTTANDRGRGWLNQRASAKRYGLDVDGL